MKNKQRIYLLFLVAHTLLGSCQRTGTSETQLSPSMDYEIVSYEDSEELIQLVLKVSIQNFQGDLLKYGISTPEEHQNRINYYTNLFKNELKLDIGNEILNCLDSHFERPQMDLPYRNFILSFPKGETPPQHLLIEDYIFSKNLIKLAIDHE